MPCRSIVERPAFRERVRWLARTKMAGTSNFIAEKSAGSCWASAESSRPWPCRTRDTPDRTTIRRSSAVPGVCRGSAGYQRRHEFSPRLPHGLHCIVMPVEEMIVNARHVRLGHVLLEVLQSATDLIPFIDARHCTAPRRRPPCAETHFPHRATCRRIRRPDSGSVSRSPCSDRSCRYPHKMPAFRAARSAMTWQIVTEMSASRRSGW